VTDGSTPIAASQPPSIPASRHSWIRGGYKGSRVADGSKPRAASWPPSFLASRHSWIRGGYNKGSRVADGSKPVAASWPPSFLASQHSWFQGFEGIVFIVLIGLMKLERAEGSIPTALSNTINPKNTTNKATIFVGLEGS